MKKLLALALLALSLPALGNGVKHIQYGVPAKISFTLYDSDGLFDATQADGGTEVTLYCDEDAGTTATNDFVRTDNTYSIVLTAAETQCARIMIDVAADQLEIVPVETFGDVNAQDKTRGVASGVAQSATSTSIVLASGTNIPDSSPANRVICITEGTGFGQCRLITAWVQSTDTATITGNWSTTPSSDSEYFVYPATQISVIALAEYLDDTADFPTLTEISDELGLLNDLSASAVNAEVDTALADYDPPTRAELTSDINGLNDLDAAGVRTAVGLASANLDDQLLLQQAINDSFLNCEINTANFAGSTTTFACILTDKDGSAVTQADNDLEGMQIVVTSGAQIREQRFINATSWDGGNSELQITLSRALPGTLADAVTVVIR